MDRCWDLYSMGREFLFGLLIQIVDMHISRLLNVVSSFVNRSMYRKK